MAAPDGERNGYAALLSLCCCDSIYKRMGLGLEGDAAPGSKTKLPGAAQQRRRVADWISLELCYHVTIGEGKRVNWYNVLIRGPKGYIHI